MTRVLLALLIVPLIATRAAAADERPNIVFIIADDLGWADVGFHGGNAPTPNLDRLCRDGLELAQHYVAPVCSPTRAALMTGRCWSRWGVTTPINDRALPPDTWTLARAMQSTGYATALCGKWHLGSLPKWGPNHFGFDYSYGSLAGGVSPWNHRYKQGPYTFTWHRNEEFIEEKGHVTDLIAQEAVNWIERHAAEPFFLYVPFTAVHLPIKEPDEWLERVPSAIQGDVDRHYAACTMHLDHAVGQILESLEGQDIRKKTIVVFTSDNGGSTAENNDLKYPDDDCPNGKLPGDNRPLRGEKGSVYEGGTRVPTIVSWPQQLPPGRYDQPVQIVDWMPTFCSLTSAQVPNDPQWDGIDLSAALLEGKSLPERSIYSVGPSWRSRSLRRGDWKLVVHSDGKGERAELYHLTSDQSESVDLAASRPQELQRMQKHLAEAAQGDRRSRQPED